MIFLCLDTNYIFLIFTKIFFEFKRRENGLKTTTINVSDKVNFLYTMLFRIPKYHLNTYKLYNVEMQINLMHNNCKC